MNTKIKIESFGDLEEVVLKFSNYQDRDKIAIIAEQEGEVYDVLTCNGSVYIAPDVVSFRSDQNYVEALVEAGYIEPEPEFIEPSGFIFLTYHKLTKEAFDFINSNKTEA